jgi:Histidine kinase-, DNA gyrase B-, and HSP90-like ATPase
MSTTAANIRRIVAEDISIRVDQFSVLFEIITNAIYANATKIRCELNSLDTPIEFDPQNPAKKRLDTIAVTDNGDGFVDENYKAFSTYRTERNKDLGCKGVGRLIYLKVYENVSLVSRLKARQEIRSFNFVLDFDPSLIVKAPEAVQENETTVSLSGLTATHLNARKHLDRRIVLDCAEIRDRVLAQIIPTLHFYGKRGVEITITFEDLTGSTRSAEITSTDVPEFSERPFAIKDGNGTVYDFTLSYSMKSEEGRLWAYYCADHRTVCSFSDKELRISLPYGYSGYFLLNSDYLHERVKNDRDDFEIFPVKTDLWSTISWETINDRLKSEISEIVKAGIPETEKINREKLKELEQERPYLINYIEDADIEIAGYLDSKQIIEKAKKRFDTAKENLLANAGKAEYTDKELKDAIEITQNELVSYVNDRAQVLERLQTLVEKKERVEEVIHNLFMTKKSDDHFFYIGKNNLWLIDDRFTTYTYAASDRRIKEVLESIGETSDGVEILNDRPDIALFFSHDPTKPKSLKSVVIEIKPFDFPSKPDREKFHGVTQLMDYLKAFKLKENVEEIVGFVVTDIDDPLATRLRDDGYVPLYSHDAPIYHRFYETPGISIYVLGAKTLIADAEARNKIFLDIIRRQSRLHEIIESDSAAGA